jgi:hypothetical protein
MYDEKGDDRGRHNFAEDQSGADGFLQAERVAEARHHLPGEDEGVDSWAV